MRFPFRSTLLLAEIGSAQVGTGDVRRGSEREDQREGIREGGSERGDQRGRIREGGSEREDQRGRI